MRAISVHYLWLRNVSNSVMRRFLVRFCQYPTSRKEKSVIDFPDKLATVGKTKACSNQQHLSGAPTAHRLRQTDVFSLMPLAKHFRFLIN